MKIKKKLRNFLNLLARIFGPEKILQIEAKIRFNKTLDLKHPKTLSDKICWLELNRSNPLIVKCSDKYEVREYVTQKGLKEILVPLVGGVYSSVEEINFDSLPRQFALKATYGCQMNLICHDKEKLDIQSAKKTAEYWLKDGFNRDVLEPHYGKIKKRIICEQYLDDADSITDYKIHCINGKPIFVLVCSEREKGLKLNLYDLSWKPIYEICGKHLNNKEIAKPATLSKMLDVAQILCQDFDFVRVDLYEIDGKVFFGELTFTPDGGMLSYYTPKFDLQIGKLLTISEE